MLIRSIALGAALFAAPAALAQTSPQTTPGTAMPGSQTTPGTPTTPGTQTTPATPAAPDASATPDASAAPGTSGAAAPVTDTEVTQFAAAALAVTKLQGDTTIPAADKNAKSIEAITAAGIDPVRFNEISQAMRNDPALNERIQKAAAAAQPAQ